MTRQTKEWHHANVWEVYSSSSHRRCFKKRYILAVIISCFSVYRAKPEQSEASRAPETTSEEKSYLTICVDLFSPLLDSDMQPCFSHIPGTDLNWRYEQTPADEPQTRLSSCRPEFCRSAKWEMARKTVEMPSRVCTISKRKQKFISLSAALNGFSERYFVPYRFFPSNQRKRFHYRVVEHELLRAIASLCRLQVSTKYFLLAEFLWHIPPCITQNDKKAGQKGS